MYVCDFTRIVTLRLLIRTFQFLTAGLWAYRCSKHNRFCHQVLYWYSQSGIRSVLVESEWYMFCIGRVRVVNVLYWYSQSGICSVLVESEW
jgi:hypothetical protein